MYPDIFKDLEDQFLASSVLEAKKISFVEIDSDDEVRK